MNTMTEIKRHSDELEEIHISEPNMNWHIISWGTISGDKIKAMDVLQNHEYESYDTFDVEHLNGMINKWNMLQRGDVISFHFQKWGNERNIHFTLSFFVVRNYSYKIIWYYQIDDLEEKRKSEIEYGEIKYTKIKWWKRRILEDNSLLTIDPVVNGLKAFINESVLSQIHISKPKEKVKSFMSWVLEKICKIIKKSWDTK
jgi:hypothetical protein